MAEHRTSLVPTGAAPVTLLVGPPGVGKSTTARALCARSARSVHLPVDALRTRVLSGYAPPEPSWPVSLVEQVRLARASAVDDARRYAAAGFAVVVDDFVDPPLLQEYDVLGSWAGVRRVVLAPRPEEARRRAAGREVDPELRRYIEQGIDLVYGLLRTAAPLLVQRGYHVLDTSDLGVEATVERILDLPVSAGPGPGAR